MIIEFQCKKCSEFLKAESAEKGHEITCGNCNFKQNIPLQGSLEVGNIIEEHMIMEKIGEGAMGSVYKASHMLMNREVALKTINPKIRQDDEAVQNFISELQMGAQLSHPNIITVFNAGFTEGVYFISMQYIDGFDLNERIDKKGPMPEKEALEIVATVADAMSYAWNDFGMIHRDLKPENFRISNRGDLMIMDFGLAKMKSDQGANEEGLVIGTPDFMSPEQASARTNIDFRADMYSLGIVLYYLLSGKRPFQSSNPLDVVAMHINKALPPMSSFAPHVKVSQSTLKLIKRMTHKNPDARFMSWEEVNEQVQSLLRSGKGNAKKKNSPPSSRRMAGSKSSSKGKSRSKTNPPQARRPRQRGTSSALMVSLAIVALGGLLFFLFVLKSSGR